MTESTTPSSASASTAESEIESSSTSAAASDRRARLRTPPARPLVAPSILSADFGRIAEECRTVLDAGADLLHLDVMDGHFVPNLTMGPDMCRAVRAHCPDAVLDVHLMVSDPGRFLESFARAGADVFTFHIEAAEHPQTGFDGPALAERIHALGLSAGLAINPPTKVDAVLPHLEPFDLILVMSVNPGYSGQSFIGEVLEKTRAIKSRLRNDQRLEMDGGINPGNASQCVEAGCDVLAAASAIFKAPDYAEAIRALRNTGTH